MDTKSLFLKYFFSVLILGAHAQSTDQTREPKAVGTDVVEAVVGLIDETCIFEDDKLLLRRIAYVETTDGTDSHTFLDGGLEFFGGIWQIKEASYDQTKATAHKDFHDAIKEQFNIDWPETHYEDLLTPLHNGLAARIWIEITRDGEIPRSVEDQAEYWAGDYQHEGSRLPSLYRDKVEELPPGCTISRGDIVITLDASGSVGSSNFDTMKEFVYELVDTFEIGDDEARVGIITYDAKVKVQVELEEDNEKNKILQAVQNMDYRDHGSGTNSHLALDKTREMFEEQSRGNSSGMPEIGIFLTDGKSNRAQDTVTAADKIHDDTMVTMFSVGVTSSIDMRELEVIGSQPSCIHVHTLGNFEEMQHFLSQISKVTCQAPAELNEGEDATGIISEGQSIYFRLKVRVDKHGVHIKLQMVSGSGRVYTSWNIRNPSGAIYDLAMSVDSTDTNGKWLNVPIPPEMMDSIGPSKRSAAQQAGEDDDEEEEEEEVILDLYVALQGASPGDNEFVMSYEEGLFVGGVSRVQASAVVLAALAALAWIVM